MEDIRGMTSIVELLQIVDKMLEKDSSTSNINILAKILSKLLDKQKISLPKITLIRENIKQLSEIDLDILSELENVNKCKYISGLDIDEIVSKKKDGDILLFLKESSSYILFNTFEEYKNFLFTTFQMGQIKSYYQIVFADEDQKVVLSYSADKNNLEANLKILSEQIQSCWGSKSIMTYNEHYGCYQIIINKLQVNKSEKNKIYYDELYKFIKDKHPDLANNLDIFHPEYEKKIDKSYIQYAFPTKLRPSSRSIPINDMIEEDYINGLIKIIKEHHNGPLTININSHNNITNNNLKIISDENVRENKTQEWINSNLPENDEQTSVYYNRYKDYMSKLEISYFGISKFNKLIIQIGYNHINTGKKHIWRKK